MSRLVQFAEDLRLSFLNMGVSLQMEDIYYATESITHKYNIEESEASIDLSNDLVKKIGTFLSSKKIDGVADTTLNTYKTVLMKFARSTPYRTSEIVTQHIRNYISIRNEKIKASSMISTISVLRNLFGWLVSEKIIIANPMERIQNPKQPKRFPKSLSLEQIENLRESCKTLRTRALFEVAYSTGLRVSELINVKITDIDFQNRVVRVIGKGDKERRVYLNYKSIHHLKKYLDAKRGNSEYVFTINRKPHTKLCVRAVQTVFKKLGRVAGMGEAMHAHAMRHSTATHLLNNGAPLSMVQKILGHSSANTTEIYCQLSDKTVQEQFDKYMPQ